MDYTSLTIGREIFVHDTAERMLVAAEALDLGPRISGDGRLDAAIYAGVGSLGAAAPGAPCSAPGASAVRSARSLAS
ncbi:MAG TPA: hypothetical protein VN786_06965, partial [Acidimicrobiales bacterium]|nr:hypothetical protein [Acidimicrobiales bacterium]